MQLPEGYVAEQIKLALRLFRGGSWAQRPDDAQVMSPCAPLRHVVLQRRPQLCCGCQHVFKTGRHDADDGIRVLATTSTSPRLLQRDLTSDNGAVSTETPPPEAVAQDHHVRPVHPIIG